jgi:tetratricopeptide (TPR) repeat protein
MKDVTLAASEQAMESCEAARQFEKVGKYQAASKALYEFWPDPNKRPNLEGLTKSARAEVLLRAGALSGWLGSAGQTTGGQEGAKDLITQSLEIFQEIAPHRVPEAQSDLALCYWREGAFDEARINLAEALKNLGVSDHELRACVLIRAGLVEVGAGRLNEAMRFFDECSGFIDGNTDYLKGTFHNSLAACTTHHAAVLRLLVLHNRKIRRGAQAPRSRAAAIP